MLYEYFISYRRGNDGIQKAREIYGLLTREVGSAGVFWDLQSIIGGRWWPQIENAIKQAKHFILLVDKGFIKHVVTDDLKNYPEKERASLNDWFFNEISLAVESKCEIHPISYDKDTFDKDACVKFPILKPFQKLDGKDKDFEFELLKHLGIREQVYESFSVNNLDSVPSTFESRVDLTKLLLDNIRANESVNFYGLGGVGKTTLVQQCVMEDFKDEFGSVVYVPVENSVLSDYVNSFEDYLLETGGKKVDSENKSKLKHKSDDYQVIKRILENHCTVRGVINLMIFDINNNNEDDKRRDVLIDERKKIVPDGWKLLMVSHSECNPNKVYNMELDSLNNSKFAEKLFDKLCDIKDLTTERKGMLLKNLFYSPLLISVIAGKINNSINVKRILRDFSSESVSHEGHKSQSVGEYLKKLISFKGLNFNQKIVASLFMVWPSRLIRDNVVCSFVRGYKFMLQFPHCRKVVCHNNDFAIKDSYKENAKANAQFQKALDALVNYNILVKSGSSYMMHAMLADELRGQFHNLVDNKKIASWFYWFRYFRGILKNDHNNYIKRSRNILGEITRRRIKDNDYVECIAHSIPLLKDLDKKYKESNFSKYFEDNDIVKTYIEEKKFVMKLANETDSGKLFDIHVEFGDFYKHKQNTLSAKDEYIKAIDIYEKQHDPFEEEHSKVVTLYLKLAEYFDTFDTDYFKKAASVYYANRSKCHLEGHYGKLIEIMPNGYDNIGVDDNSTADFYYRLGRFYDHYYWLNRKVVSDYAVKAKRYYKIADDIWMSQDTEIDGELKGFVKTSYGFCDKKYGFKFVKVDGGTFDMGLSLEEWKMCHENVKKENNSYLMATGQGANSDSYYNYERGNTRFSDEIPSHSVTVSEYYISTLQVTNKQWRDIMGFDSWRDVKVDGNKQSLRYYENLKEFKVEGDYDEKNSEGYYGGKSSEFYDMCAMNYVNFYDAVEFCNKMSELFKLDPVYTIIRNEEGVIEGVINNDKFGFRLPTEAEWEYAARGGSQGSMTIYSGSNFCYDVAHYDPVCDPQNPNNSQPTRTIGNIRYGNGTQPVGILKPNELGIYDMSGNVYEWCQDWYNKSYYDQCRENPDLSVNPCCEEQEVVEFVNGVSGPARVVRGGSWNLTALFCRVSSRVRLYLANRFSDFGLRLLLSSPKKEEKQK